MDVVAMIDPFALVARSALGTLVIANDVAFDGNGSWSAVPVASVPQYRMPPFDFTSQLPAERLVTVSEVVVAFPKSAVVMVPEAIVVLPFAVRVPEKMLVFVKVFEE